MNLRTAINEIRNRDSLLYKAALALLWARVSNLVQEKTGCLCGPFCHCKQNADELTYRSMNKLLNNRQKKTAKKVKNADAWIRVLVRSVVHDYWRSKQCQKNTPTDDYVETLESELMQSATTTDVAMDRVDLRAAVDQMLLKKVLTKMEHQLYQFLFVEEMSQTDASEKLGITSGRVSQVKSSLVQKIRAWYSSEEDNAIPA